MTAAFLGIAWSEIPRKIKDSLDSATVKATTAEIDTLKNTAEANAKAIEQLRAAAQQTVDHLASASPNYIAYGSKVVLQSGQDASRHLNNMTVKDSYDNTVVNAAKAKPSARGVQWTLVKPE